MVTCKRLQTDLNTLLSSLDKLRIDRLTVIDASWPLLKKLTHTTIKSLRIVRCNVQEVEESAFESVANTLEELVLANNSLTSFPLLGELYELRILDLNNNKLKNVPRSSFSGVPRLRQLRLEGNVLENLDSDVFKSLSRSLEVLDLSNNNFANVPAAAISYTRNLKYFDLSCNKITTIRDGEFKNLNKIIEIRLNGNSIEDFYGSAFGNSKQLQYLYLQENAISKVASLNFLKKLERLEILDLSNNMLTTVPLLQGHKSIRQMKLDGNKISVVRKNAFNGNSRLQLLSLQSNQITSLDSGIFEGLNQLTILLLENNVIQKLEKRMFRGVRRLQQLNLRNNSLNELENNSFEYVPELKMIDMAYNGLHYIPKNLFSPLRNLVWLDLSFNVLSSFEEGTFRTRIPHIILVGNPLECNTKIEWFVAYLIKNQVRTHLPLHPEVVCALPEKYAGIRLQDLITKKAEETLSVVSKSLNPQILKNDDFLSGFVPSGIMRMISSELTPPPPNPVADVPIIGGIAEAVPAIRNIPGLSFIPKPHGIHAEEAKSLNSAIEQFSTPLLRLTSGDSLLIAEDLDQMVKAVPKLALASRVDLAQLPPEVITRAYRGEGISGISKEAAELSLKNHVLDVYKSALAISKGMSLLDQPNHLLVLNSVPDEIVADIVSGAKLPYLTEEQTKVVKEYFDVNNPKSNLSNANEALSNIKLTPEIFQLAKLLPKNYDLNKIPKSLIKSVTNGEMPDLANIPDDLKQHFKSKYEQLFAYFAKTKKIKVEELVKQLPTFERAEGVTFTPYTMDMQESRIKKAKGVSELDAFHSTAVGVLCFLGVLSIAVIILSSLGMRRKNATIIEASTSDCSSTSTPDSPALPRRNIFT
uniref:LRRCT domain-containing protein n=1 Tax=Syphacia muris TaxID=451379 RepID=A0A158R476_9BILA